MLLQPLGQVLAEGIDEGELGRRVVVERVDGHTTVELQGFVAALGAQVVHLVVAVVSGLQESGQERG